MRWIFDNPEIIVAIAGAFAYWLKRRKEQQQEDEASSSTPPASTPTAMADDEAQRTRRIQEEIRRKIAERRGGHAPAPAPAQTQRLPLPPVVAERPLTPADFGDDRARMREVLARKLAQARERAAVEFEAQEERAHRETERLQRERVAADREAAAAIAGADARLAKLKAEGAPGVATRVDASPWLDILRDPDSIRRAVVLREILDPPVALRRGNPGVW